MCLAISANVYTNVKCTATSVVVSCKNDPTTPPRPLTLFFARTLVSLKSFDEISSKSLP